MTDHDPRLATLAKHGVVGNDATTALAALDQRIAAGAPELHAATPWLDTLTTEQRAGRMADWYGHDALRAAAILCRYPE